jgi:hypothetical protein
VIPFLRWRPFERQAERAARLPLLLIPGLGLLLLCLWDPLAHPGPVLCVSRRALAVPCPLCGATRGVALCLRGRPVEASAYNPLSAPALVLAVVLLALWSAEYATGYRLEVRVPPRVRSLGMLAVYLALAASWIYVLAYHREDDFANSWVGQVVGLFW